MLNEIFVRRKELRGSYAADLRHYALRAEVGKPRSARNSGRGEGSVTGRRRRKSRSAQVKRSHRQAVPEAGARWEGPSCRAREEERFAIGPGSEQVIHTDKSSLDDASRTDRRGEVVEARVTTWHEDVRYSTCRCEERQVHFRLILTSSRAEGKFTAAAFPVRGVSRLAGRRPSRCGHHFNAGAWTQRDGDVVHESARGPRRLSNTEYARTRHQHQWGISSKRRRRCSRSGDGPADDGRVSSRSVPSARNSPGKTSAGLRAQVRPGIRYAASGCTPSSTWNWPRPAPAASPSGRQSRNARARPREGTMFPASCNHTRQLAAPGYYGYMGRR